MPSQGTYQIITDREVTEWDDATQEVRTGHRIKVRSGQTSAVFSVFVPTTHYSDTNVDAIIRHQLEVSDNVHGLGQ